MEIQDLQRGNNGFYSLNDIVCGRYYGITPITKGSEPVNPNRNLFIERMGLIPIHWIFFFVLLSKWAWPGRPVRSISCQGRREGAEPVE